MNNPLTELTDDDFRHTVKAAIRLVAILTLVALPLVWWKMGWQSAVLLVIGAAISGSGLFEWLRLMTAVMHRMDAANDGPADHDSQPKTTNLSTILVGFFLRLGATVLVLYVSLKYLDGSAYALAAGLSLGLFALAFEALRMMKLWTV